ncbi:hypothetical protein J1N51_05955 [Psychrosphaera ytuae]|uniref:Uncharacterized protein n=1 Tax=Psychrosphaera ytuae TaxID=2820710 RepID=A0A975DG20_9GAMM|nr:hypothetical protein [Psychrosphaera ytuae]QTH64990.1 hypothetical protein J1N51_05955 [Psychrosphaera ytuae]
MIEKNKWIISLALAFLSLVIPIVLYFASIPERSIIFEVVSKTDLVGSLGGIDGLEIKIKDKQIKEASLYLVKLKNTGTEPIMAGDFEKPMLIKLDSEIFSVKAKDKSPENLTLEYLIKGESILVEPFLFNSDEEFSLEIVSSSKTYPTVDSRIAGISSIKENYPSKSSIKKITISLILSFVLLVFYSKSFSLFIKRKNQKISNFTLGITCAFSSVILTKEVVEIEAYNWYFFALILIPIYLGTNWAILENGGKKSIQPTAETPAD